VTIARETGLALTLENAVERAGLGFDPVIQRDRWAGDSSSAGRSSASAIS
jgi:hypothetical protein